MYLDFVGRNSFYAFLAQEGDRLFPDQRFESWYHVDNGRPCVSPCLLTKVLLLQMYDRCSDAEAVERAAYDLRWKVALRIRPEERPFAKSTLQMHRARIHLHDWAENLILTSVQEAQRVGILKGSKINVAIDTTPVFGRGAVKDTFNLIADAIKQLCRALASVKPERPEVWAKRNDLGRYWSGTSLKGDADIDWTSGTERQVFLKALVADVDRILLLSDRALSVAADGLHAEEIRKAADLLRQIVAQDVDRNETGGPKIKQEVSQDRTISVSDPEMRHGRKSASKRFDGHKASLAVEPESQVITAVKVSPGNGADAATAMEMVEKTEKITGQQVEKAIGDCAYGDGATRKQFADANRLLVAKVPTPPEGEAFHKAHFKIDVDGDEVTCPAGHTTKDWVYLTNTRKPEITGAHVKRFRFPKQLCQACPFFSSCVGHKKAAGRILTMHPQEKLLQEAKAYQTTEAFRQDKRLRQAVEHRIARLIQLGMRQSRYFGRAKTEFQLLLAAAVANLTLVHLALVQLLIALFAVTPAVRSPWGQHPRGWRASQRILCALCELCGLKLGGLRPSL
jgi:hypothetical protein